jgi:hypothetical protein
LAAKFLHWPIFIRTLAKNTSQSRFFVETTVSLVLSVFKPLFKALGRAFNRTVLTPSQYSRFDEIIYKMNATISQVLGNDAKEFIGLDLLACTPEKHGLGYGGALVRAVTQIVS